MNSESNAQILNIFREYFAPDAVNPISQEVVRFPQFAGTSLVRFDKLRRKGAEPPGAFESVPRM